MGESGQIDRPTFAGLKYRGRKRKTRQEIFPEQLDRLIHWYKLEDRIRLSCLKARRGCRPSSLVVMLRVLCV